MRPSFDFDHAEPASAGGLQALIVTKGRHFDVQRAQGVKDREGYLRSRRSGR